MTIDEASIAIWSSKENLNAMINAIHIPVVKEYEQYRNYIGALARLITEGFNKGTLQTWANHLKIQNEDENIGSINLLEKCLNVFKGEYFAKDTITPLKRLNRIKSSIGSHGGGSKIPENKIISESKELLIEVAQSMEKISKALS